MLAGQKRRQPSASSASDASSINGGGTTTQASRADVLEAALKKDDRELVASVQAFCEMRLQNQTSVADIMTKLRTKDNQKKAFKESVFGFLKQGDKKSVQVDVGGTAIQALIKQKYEYDVPTLVLLQQIELDFDKVMRMDAESGNAFMFKTLQVARRKTKHVLEVKKCGIRNIKKLPSITDRAFADAVKQVYELENQTKNLRRQKKTYENNKQKCYLESIAFLQRRKLSAQTINIRSDSGAIKNKVLIRLKKPAKAKTLAGKDLKIFVRETLETLRQKSAQHQSSDARTLFNEALMNRIYDHQESSKNKQLQLHYEIV